MDDDARPAPGAFAAFHAQPRPLDTALAAAVYFPDGGICEMNRPSVNPFWNPKIFLRALFKARNGYHIPYDSYEATTPRAIDLTSFVGFFLPRRMIEEAGYPDPGLFLYGDDVIYTLGLRRRGEVECWARPRPPRGPPVKAANPPPHPPLLYHSRIAVPR